jgi:tetratricopeptide (TPR) repeat protein
LENPAAVVADYTRCAELVESSAVVRIAWASALADLDRADDALAQLRKALEISPSDPRAHAGLGWCLLLTESYKESAQASEEALRLDARLSGAAFNLGLAYVALGREADARSAYRRAIAIARREESTAAILQAALADFDRLPPSFQSVPLAAEMRNMIRNAQE